MFSKAREIYSILEDDLSKKLFEGRVMFGMTGDYEYIDKMICNLNEIKEIKNCSNKKHNYIFGCGDYGKLLLRILDVSIDGFIDNFSKEKKICGIPLVPLAKVEMESNIYISPKDYNIEILKQIEKWGGKVQVINAGGAAKTLASKQYFDLTYLPKRRKSYIY